MEMPSLITLKNGPKVRPTFSTAEMNRRLSLLRTHMAEQSIDAIVLTSIHNINYYGDFLYCSVGRSYALVVTPDTSVLITTNIDGGQGYHRSLGENLLYTDWKRDNYILAVKQVLPFKVRNVGFEQDQINLDNLRKFQHACPNGDWVDIAPATMRMVKSDEEIALIKIGAAVADIGGPACVAAIAENAPDYEVALAATAAMTREIARRVPHSELRDTWTWFQSGINTDGAHHPVTTRRVQHGDILSLNCFPMIAGYYTALERTLFFGQPSVRHLELWEIN